MQEPIGVRDLFSHWEVPFHSPEKLAEADAILTHEFGDQEHVSATTRRFVTLGVELARTFRKPMICQYPGDRVTREYGIEPTLVIKEHLLTPGKYLDTEEVNRQAAKYCRAQEPPWKKLIVLSHPDHVWRLGRNLHKHHGIEPRYPDLSSIEYDPQCLRRSLSDPYWARTERFPWVTPGFRPREVLLSRPYYLMKGWL